MPPSIFNDVIGPVMRGPSSSHVVAAYRMGKIARASVIHSPARVSVSFDSKSSLAHTYHGHGSDFGFVGGFLNIDMADPRITGAVEIAKESGIEVVFRIEPLDSDHPSFYRIETADDKGHTQRWDAISTGGGMFEMVGFNGFPLRFDGGSYLVLVETADARGLDPRIRNHLSGVKKSSLASRRDRMELLVYELGNPPAADEWEKIRAIAGGDKAVLLPLVLPVQSRYDCRLPFESAGQLLEYAKGRNGQMWEYALEYECRRSGLTEGEAFEKMGEIIDVMRGAVLEGLAGTSHPARLLGEQAKGYLKADAGGRLTPLGALQPAIAYITAIMEVKSSMGVIVAAPTAGSCGCLPGSLLGLADAAQHTRDSVIKGMLAAGLIGVFIAGGATFSAELAGCQVECGAGSAMAAAGLAQMLGGDVKTCLAAASLGLQAVTGLACDPVAGGVEVPCLGKNVMGGCNAFACANMALAGYAEVIGLDETIQAVRGIGMEMPASLRCTCGGLGATPTSLRLMKERDGLKG